ncbi:MAG: amino acid adenylation domain-containing protein [Anaerolineae bacterium]
MTDILEAVRPPATKNTLSPAQRALLEKRLRGAPARVKGIPRRTDSGPAPLSFAQQRMWFHDQLEPGQPTYNVPIAVTLTGPLDIAALEDSLNAIIQRHAILRTTFTSIEGEPVQVVAPTLHIPLVVIDVTSQTKADVEAQLIQGARAPFDLTQGPLLRAQLLRLAETEFIFQLTFHHIVFDGWSLGVFFQELETFYRAHVTGRTAVLPELSIQYADFAVWQREWLEGEPLQQQLAYWKQRLSGALPVLQLPTDRPRPLIQTHNGALHHFTLSHALRADLQILAQREGASLFMLLLAAFEVLLYRYTRQADILIGVPIANRTRNEIESLIGFFVNTLALRGDLSGDPTFHQLLDRVRQSALEAYEHQDLPFERLVEALQPERDLSRNPLFQVMFVFHNAGELTSLHLQNISAASRTIDSGTAIFDLTLTFDETDTDLNGYFEYNTDLFDADTIQRMTRHLEMLLQGIVTSPYESIATLPILTEAEKQQILVDWNDTATDYPQDRCAHHGFELQAQKTPDAVAIIAGQQRFTYHEINARANQLARYLHKLGAGPETLIGLYIERSAEAVIGLLGILKAGAAYLPLDPTYPPARTALMLEDAKVGILLTQSHLVHNLTAPPLHTICLDYDWTIIANESSDNPTYPVTPDNLAYVIYTSGSTGRPKGVMVTHRGLSNYLHWCTRAYDVADGQGAPVHSAMSFDLTITSLFPSLLTGRTLTLLPETPGGEALGEAFRHHRDFSLIKLTPAHLDILTHLVPADETAGRTRAFIIGGEALRGENLTFWQTHAPNTRLINEYGPTETVVGCCVYEVPQGKRIMGAVPIGRPIANTQLYILDPQGQPVPIGAPGELYIGGDGVARGYLNRPALTAERFVPDPFGNKPGGRLYRSGDLARYLPDGNIEYLGRIDQQVKVRGYRVELGEIEAELLRQPFVKTAAVVAVKDTAGQNQLVAYIVPEQGIPINSEALREELREILPSYMIPTHYVMRDGLPLTPNGKVDHQALAALDNVQVTTSTTYVAPRTMHEKQLAAIWEDVLGVERVGIYDNFFELGGHSLQAVRLISTVSANLNHPLPIKTIFLHPTVEALAHVLSQGTPDFVPFAHQPSVSASIKEGCFPSLSHIAANSPFVTIDRQPLLTQFVLGKLAPVDSVALAYLDTVKAEDKAILQDWFGDVPLLTDVLETSLGRIALIYLPIFEAELYSEKTRLTTAILDGLKMAQHIGARVVSLPGLLAPATEYGVTIHRAAKEQPELPVVTTGYATIAAGTILVVEKILEQSGRKLSHEHVGVLGLGSISETALRLLLRSHPHPKTIILCDLYSKMDVLEKLKHEIVTDLGFEGTVHIAHSQVQAPAELYEATLIIGATNVPEVLDIMRVKPGTLIVDESTPRCFNRELAIQRFERDADILFSKGDTLESPHAIQQISYMPQALEGILSRYSNQDEFTITRCVLSSLLSAQFKNLKPTVGLVQVDASLQHYTMLHQLGFESGDLHCETYTLDPATIQRFRQHFGNTYER